MRKEMAGTSFPSVLQDYFIQRLINQMNASPRTIASYRDTFRLLLQYAEEKLGKSSSAVDLSDLDAPFVLGFLNHLEKNRKNAIRTRNARLASIRSFMKYAGLREPAALAVVQRVLAIPAKRYQRPLVGFLTREEMNAILDAPSRTTWNGRRDRAMFSAFYNTGARVSEIVGLRICDVFLGKAPYAKIHGKGRKERTVPLWKNTATHIKEWLKEVPNESERPLFPNRRGELLTRSGVENRLRESVRQGSRKCPSLSGRQVSPHVLRHTTAMHLLQSGVDLSVIALWLGHESSSTTHIYLDADLSMKEKALRKVQGPDARHTRFKPSDKVLQFLESL